MLNIPAKMYVQLEKTSYCFNIYLYIVFSVEPVETRSSQQEANSIDH